MSNCLYTKEELIEKLKELDEQMDDATTRSDLDSGQSKQSFSVSIRTLEKQYEKYKTMFQNCFPADYRAMFGNSVIKFGGTC